MQPCLQPKSVDRGQRATGISRRGRCVCRNLVARRRVGLSCRSKASSQAARRGWRRRSARIAFLAGRVTMNAECTEMVEEQLPKLRSPIAPALSPHGMATAAADQAEPGFDPGPDTRFPLPSPARRVVPATSPRAFSALSHRARSGWSLRRRVPMPSTVLRVAQIPFGCGPYGPRDTALIPIRLARVAIGALPL
jgi:hypothetical protein